MASESPPPLPPPLPAAGGAGAGNHLPCLAADAAASSVLADPSETVCPKPSAPSQCLAGDVPAWRPGAPSALAEQRWRRRAGLRCAHRLGLVWFQLCVHLCSWLPLQTTTAVLACNALSSTLARTAAAGAHLLLPLFRPLSAMLASAPACIVTAARATQVVCCSAVLCSDGGSASWRLFGRLGASQRRASAEVRRALGAPLLLVQSLPVAGHHKGFIGQHQHTRLCHGGLPRWCKLASLQAHTALYAPGGRSVCQPASQHAPSHPLLLRRLSLAASTLDLLAAASVQRVAQQLATCALEMRRPLAGVCLLGDLTAIGTSAWGTSFTCR